MNAERFRRAQIWQAKLNTLVLDSYEYRVMAEEQIDKHVLVDILVLAKRENARLKKLVKEMKRSDELARYDRTFV